MIYSLSRKTTLILAAATAIVVLLFGTPITFAQGTQLTPEQQRLLNQLPPAQRQQALDSLGELSRGSSSSKQQSSLSEELTSAPLNTDDLPESTGERRATRGGHLVINITVPEDPFSQDAEIVELEPALERIRGSQFFELDESGVLVLPGLSNIPLLGLTAEAIEKRLGAEPPLSPFDIEVTILDTETTGAEALEPFGYDVFESATSGFEPVTSGPVPPDYVLGPGDSVRVQFFGNVNSIRESEVSRDGILNLAEIGPITVAGLTFSEFRSDLGGRVQEMLIGTQVSATIGQLRTIRVFVLGDAHRPGSYVVNSLATISSALYASGGISDIGSLRNIQLKRRGRLVRSLDLYDLLLNGDTSGDHRLQSGDVIFIPPIGEIVGVGGKVRRPAIYEIKGNANVADVLRLAGGMLPDAFPDGARLERINSDKQRIVISVDADSPAGTGLAVAGGDTLIVPEVLRELNHSILLEGHVQRPGPYQLLPGMRLTDLISSAQDLNPGADADYVMIRREDPSNRHVHVVSANLREAWSDPAAPENIRLQARDTVHVFSLAFGRQRVVSPILEELQLQSRRGTPNKEVHVAGHVRAPGTYPMESGMRVSDVIRAGGSLAEDAYVLEAELTRYSVIDDNVRATDIIDIDLDAVLRGVESADLVLTAHDHLRINAISQWNSEWSVMLEGEVRFPGNYRIRRGEKLSEVLERAGGLTSAAFPEGAIFLREALREREQEQIDLLADRMESDLASLSLEAADSGGSETLSTGRVLLEQLRGTQSVGRLVIDLDRLLAEERESGAVTRIELKDGDKLMVPTRSQVVTVIGETQQNTSHVFQPGLSRDRYIDMSGGLTRRADKKLIYVVRANGAVVAANRSKWFGRGGKVEIRPGDTIVVPLETDRIRPLALWSSVTQILYQGALAVAAIQTFDN